MRKDKAMHLRPSEPLLKWKLAYETAVSLSAQVGTEPSACHGWSSNTKSGYVDTIADVVRAEVIE